MTVNDNRRSYRFLLVPVASIGRVSKTVRRAVAAQPAMAVAGAVLVGLGGTVGVAAANRSDTPVTTISVTLHACEGVDLTAIPGRIYPNCDRSSPAPADVTYRENSLWGPSRTVADIEPWTGSSPPSARDCGRLLADRALTSVSLRRAGALCVATHSGGFAYVWITGQSSWGIDLRATVLR